MNNKYFDLLPLQHQTGVNKNFFESTVEQLFAKANIEDVSGYVGRRIPGVDNDPNTVFIEQPAPNREYYSLEPTVTTIEESTGKPDTFSFYEDFIFNHRTNGGLVGNHDRIFKTEQYNFAPPIDLDKFVNYHNYYWYAPGPEPIQVLGNSSVNIVIDNVVGKKQFTSPNNVVFKSGMVVQFSGTYVSGTDYDPGRSYIIEGVGVDIRLEEIPTADMSISAYGEFKTQPYDGNAVPNSLSTGSRSNTDPVGTSVLSNILALANTNINSATFDFDIARPAEYTSISGTTIRASFDTDFGEAVVNGNQVRVNIFDGTNKTESSTTGTAYGFVGAYITLADGSSPSKTLDLSATFSDAGGDVTTDLEIITNKLFLNNVSDLYVGVDITHPDVGQATVTAVNSDHVVISASVTIYNNSSTSITFGNQKPQFTINNGSGAKTITLDSGTSGSDLKEADLNTYSGVANAAIIASPLDLMDAINNVGIANLSVVATTSELKIIENNGNAVTITNVTNDARNNPFVGSSNTSGLDASTPAVDSSSLENQTFAISNKTSTSFDIVLPSGTARLIKNNGTFINYGSTLSDNLVQVYSEDKRLTASANIFFDKTIGTLTAGTPTQVVGTPDTKTFFINTGVQAYGGQKSGSDFTQPRQGKFNLPAYTEFLQANGTVQTASEARVGFDEANIEVINYDVSTSGALLTYAWDGATWDNTPIQNIADYLVIAKGSKNKNPWSRLNYWYHVDALKEPLKDNDSQFSIPTGAIRAVRPILEFNRDMELQNWGNSFITTVDIVADKPKEELEGLAIGFPINSSSGSEGETIIFPNNESDVAKKIYRINDSNGLIQFSEVTSLTPSIVKGGHVFSTGGSNAGKDYFWNGDRWQQAQQKLAVQQAPLFTLYDDEGVKVDNIAKYPNSDFVGCPVFSYNTNNTTGTYDEVLKANVVYKSGKISSEPTFHNHLEHHTVTYKTTPTSTATTIPGYLYYKDLNQDYEGRDNELFKNNWHPVNLPSNYRNFSNVATYHEGEVVKYENSYFVANSDITAGNFDISEYKHYEDVYATTSKQYVEDVIIVTDITKSETAFTTSAVPYNNDIDVYQNEKKLVLGTDFSIKTEDQGITFTDNVTLNKDDIITVKTYTKKDRLTNLDAYGFFEIPEVLKFNPKNTSIHNIAFSDTVNHFHTVIEDQEGFTGSVSGSNNYRNTSKDVSTTRVKIAQTSDDIITPMFLSKSPSRDFINALRFGGNEYIKFKNKFIGSAESYLNNNDYLQQTNLEIIDTVLKTIKSSKVSKEAHSLSYMAPIGTSYTTTSVRVSNASVLDYTFDNTIDLDSDTVLFVITHNNNVLCAEKDFTVESTLPLDIKLSSNVNLSKNDTLEVRIYDDSEESLVPASLSKLGIAPAYEPMFMSDTSYQTDLDVIRCHDGSYIPRQNEKIDDIILAFETIIYNNIKGEYRTADRSEEFCFIKDVKPSKYYDTDYQWYEVNDLLENSFNKWVKATGIDWRLNNIFDSSNKFTWNYESDYKSPGHWRGVFDYYYDTQTPDTTPWEMFGFVKKPSWWDREYPDAITSAYTEFWNNVSTGYIPAGKHKGYHKRWARPSVVIPVNSTGDILPPQEIMFSGATAGDISNRNNWKFGDGSPAEYAWKKSSYYPFAVAEAMYLARPALFFASFMDKSDRLRTTVSTQVVSKATRRRVGFENFEPHGYISEAGDITIKFGISTLIDSYLKFQSLITNVELSKPMRTVDTRLGHKFGGFINDKNLKVFSDSLSVDGFSAGQRIPKEDVITRLHTSGYNSRNFYTGIKVIKTSTGYTVTGYDSVSQMFDIIPSDKSGPVQGVAEGGTPVTFSTFDTQVDYPRNSFIKLGSTYYQAKDNVTAGTFDSAEWTKLAELPTEGGAQATYYQRPLGETAKVPYNVHYEDVADVFDLLIGIGRYQQASGYDFGEFDTSINDVNDWLLAGKRFLFWTTEDHVQNDSIVLSPMAEEVRFESSTGKISEIKNSLKSQYSLVDSDGGMINIRQCGIVRQDNSITITPPEGKAIFGCLLHTELLEHAVVLNNRTAFNDLIYDNVLGVRQDRVVINTQRSRNWDGRFSAEGMIISSSGSVLPNFDLLVDSIRDYHDNSKQTIDPVKTDLARGLIGFEKDSSLANIKLSDSAQFDFYKGSIRNKGTANSMTSLLRSNVVNTNKNIEISEEWAIKRGEFGDVFNHQSMDISLKQSDFITDNQQVEILYPENITGTVSNIFVYERNTTYFKTPSIEIDPPATGGNAAQATATLYANALLESVTITDGGDGYDAKPNVAVITGNIVVARIDEVLHHGLAYSSSDVDVPLTGTSALSNITITDYTTTANTSVDIDLANARSLEHTVTQINKQLTAANVSDVVAFSDLDTDVEKLNITSVTAGTPVRITTGSQHGFNAPSTTRANASIQSITSANTAILTLDQAAIGTGSFSSGDIILFQNVVGGTGFGAMNNTVFYVKETGTDYQYEIYTNKALTTGANTASYTGTANGGDAYASANVDNIKVAGLTSISNGDYYAFRQSATQFDLYEDPTLVVPVTNVGSVSSDAGTLEVYGSGGDKRLYIRGSDFQLAESTLPGGNPSTSLSVLNMVAGRYQPQQRFAIQTANNTTSSDIIVNIAGKDVSSTFFTFDNGNRNVTSIGASQLNSKLATDSFTVDLTGAGEMLDNNIVEIDGQYPYIEFYINGTEIKNSPNYKAVSVSNAINGTTRVTFSNVSQYANNISIGSNVTIAEMGTVQFANTLTTDVPGAKLSIKSVANDTIIANTTSKRTYKVTKDNPLDNKITIDIDDTEQMLKRPTNTLDKGVWPTTTNTLFSIPNAGYVNRANVEWEAFDISNFDSIIGTGLTYNPRRGQYLHLAKSENEDWNVFELRLHGYQDTVGSILPATNFVDEVNGQTTLFSNYPLSPYTDGNRINQNESRFFDNHVVVKNANLSNIVLRWSNERVIATPRTVFTGAYVPLKRISRKILSMEAGAKGNITAATPSILPEHSAMIYANLQVPLSNVEFYRSAGVIRDVRDPSITNSVLVTVDNIEGLESDSRPDTSVPDNVYFYGSGATAANITVGKAYPVNGIAALDTQDNGAGGFYITEANITATDYARIGTGNCFVGFESIFRQDTTVDITGITPSSGKITFKAGELTDLTNSSNVTVSTNTSFSTVDTIPAGIYSVADVDTNAKTFSITSSDFVFHDVSVAKTGFNKLSITSIPLRDGVHSLVTSGASDRIQGAYATAQNVVDSTPSGKYNDPDFVHFVSDGSEYAGNVYPVIQSEKSDESSAVYSAIYNPTSNSTAVSNAIVYKGEFTDIQGNITAIESNTSIKIENFDYRKIGTYGLGHMRFLNGNSAVNAGAIPNLVHKKYFLNKKTDANVITTNASDGIRNLKTSFIVDIDRNVNENTADIRFRNDGTAGDLGKLLFKTGHDTTVTQDMLKDATVQVGPFVGTGRRLHDWSSKYNGKPMYIGALAGDQMMSFEALIDSPSESFSKVDEIEAELEFRYIDINDLETLNQLTRSPAPRYEPDTVQSKSNNIDKGKGFYDPRDDLEPISGTPPVSKRLPYYQDPLERIEDLDWWVETYTKPMNKPSLDGFKMNFAVRGGYQLIGKSPVQQDPTLVMSSPLELWKRYPGEHASSNFTAPERQHITVSEINGVIDKENPTVKFKFHDRGRDIPNSIDFVSKVRNASGFHGEQAYKNRYKLKNQNNNNVLELQPNHPSASTRPMEWWSNEAKSVMAPEGGNRFRVEFGYQDGRSLYPSALDTNTIIPVVIVKKLNVKYTLSPVTNLKLDNLRISLTGGNIAGIKDFKIEGADNTFITVDNSNNFIPNDETAGTVKAVVYRNDENRNKQILVNDLGSPIKRSEPDTDRGYSAMLFTTTNANSSFNTGNVFGYVTDKSEHMTSAGSMFVGLPDSRKTNMSDWFDNDFGAVIKYLPLNYTGRKNININNVDVTFHTAVYKNESKIFTSTEGLSNTDIVTINDTLNVSGIEGQSNVSTVGKTFISIPKGIDDNIINHAIGESQSANLEIISNSSISLNQLTFTDPGHGLQVGSEVIFHTGNNSDYLNNTSFEVKDVTSNTFKVNVANTSCVPSSNISSLKYGAVFSSLGGNLDVQYYVDTRKIYHFACNNKNNILTGGDNVRFYAGTVDTASLNGTTAIIAEGTERNLSIPLASKPTALTSNLTIRYADDVNRNIITLPPKYTINNLFARISRDDVLWGGFTNDLEVNISTYDSDNNLNKRAEFSGFLGNTIPGNAFASLPMKIFTATDFRSEDHGIGKELNHAQVLSTTAASSEGLVNVRIENGGPGLYESGFLHFSDSVNDHVLSGNKYQILDFVTLIDEDGDQGEQHYTIKAPGATATTTEFSVSYVSYRPNKDRPIKLIRNGRYSGFATPVALTKDTFTVETPYLGPIDEDSGAFWVNDIILVEGTSDLASEMKLRPKLDALTVSGATRRNLNAKYRIALPNMVSKSPRFENDGIAKTIVPVYGFLADFEKIKLDHQDVNYSLEGWNMVRVNGAKTEILNPNSLQGVADSLNFAATFKEGTIRRIGSIQTGFLFGTRDVSVDNPNNESYNRKYIQTPTSMENLQLVHHARDGVDGNVLKDGVNRFLDTTPKQNSAKLSPQIVVGQYMLDMNNLGQIQDKSAKAKKLTNRGSGSPVVSTLDGRSEDNKTVYENHRNLQNQYLDINLDKEIAAGAHSDYVKIGNAYANGRRRGGPDGPRRGGPQGPGPGTGPNTFAPTISVGVDTRPPPRTSCPSPEMPIVIDSNGNTKPAGKLAVGDTVYTAHEHTNEYGLYSVEYVEIKQEQRIKIKFSNDFEFIGSLTHKFKQGDDWVEVQDLSIGDNVQGHSVVSIDQDIVDDIVIITVTDAHTYIVGELLSHNKTYRQSIDDGAIGECEPTYNSAKHSFCASGYEDENGCCYPLGFHPSQLGGNGPQGTGPQGTGPQGTGPQGPGPSGPGNSDPCGAFSITLYDINNPGEPETQSEFDPGLLSIVQAYWNSLNSFTTYEDDYYVREEDRDYSQYEQGQYRASRMLAGYIGQFMAADGTLSQWRQYLSYLNGTTATSDNKVKYNEAIIDLCETTPGFVKQLDGDLCSNSGEVMFLGNQRIALTENCDPCALADGINVQNSDYRAICGEPSRETVNCVIPGGGQAWGETQFGSVVDLTRGTNLIEEALRWGNKKPKVKGDNPNYLTDCYGEVQDRRDPLSIRIVSAKPGQGFSGLVEQLINDKGIDPIAEKLQSIVLRIIMSAEKDGDIVNKKIIGSGSGIQPKWYDIRYHGRDTCNWVNVDWTQMKSKGGPGLNLGGAEILMKGFKPGVSWLKFELQLSHHDDKDFGSRTDVPGHKLRQMNYDLTKQGTNRHKNFGQNKVLGLMVRGIVFSEGSMEEYTQFEQRNDEETGWGYKKIVGYGDKMGGPDTGKEKDRTYYHVDRDGSDYFFKKLWDIHPVQQRRKAGCFNDIDIPVLSAVKIKSAVPFSLGLGCSRSPFTEVGDFMPYVEKKSTSSANLALGLNLTGDSYHSSSTGSGFTSPKILTTKVSAGGIQLAESTGVPSQSNPFMTADYLRMDGFAVTPRSGEGTRGGAPEDANVTFAPGEIEDSTGFNYRIGDKLTIVGGQPKALDNSAFYLDKIEIQNPGSGYNPADTRFEVVDKYDHNNKLPGVSLRATYATNPDLFGFNPSKTVGRTASAYYHSFYREYVEQGGGTTNTWINEQTVPNYVEVYTSSVEELNIEGKRFDVPVEQDDLWGQKAFKITNNSELIEAGREYRVFVGTRDYENAGSMMMFGLGIHDQTEIGEDLIKNSKIYDNFSQDELAELAGSWICCWEIPGGTVYPNGHNPKANFETLTEGSTGLLKVFMDSDQYNEEYVIDQTPAGQPTEDDTDLGENALAETGAYQHFLSRSVQRFNGRVVEFLRVSRNRVYFKVLTTLGLEKSPNFEAYGMPNFANLWSRFYPIDALNTFQDDHTQEVNFLHNGISKRMKVSVMIDEPDDSTQYKSKNIQRFGEYTGSEFSGSRYNGFRFNQLENADDEQWARVRVVFNRFDTDTPIEALNQNWDIFLIQKDVGKGYLRMPAMGHTNKTMTFITERDPESDQIISSETKNIEAVRFANAMQKIHYNTVYRPVSSPYVKMGESEALVFKFNFDNVPEDAEIEDIDIDFILRSTMPADYGMIWLQAPDGSRLPLMQFLGQTLRNSDATTNQGGQIPSYNVANSNYGATEMIFTVSSNRQAESVAVNGDNLKNYGSKVRPWTGKWRRIPTNYGRDLNGFIYNEDYDHEDGDYLRKTTNTNWDHKTQNLLKNWINGKERTVDSALINGVITYEQLDRPLIIAQSMTAVSPRSELNLRTALGMSPGDVTNVYNIMTAINDANMYGQDYVYARRNPEARDVSKPGQDGLTLHSTSNFAVQDCPAVLGFQLGTQRSLGKRRVKGNWYIEITRPGRNLNLVNNPNNTSLTLARRPSDAVNVGITDYTTAVKAPNLKISYRSASDRQNQFTESGATPDPLESISKIEIVQKGGFQAEFAMRNWIVKAIGGGEGFKARAILAKGELLAEDNPDMVEQSAQFEVTEINTSGSITKLRILDRGVYEIFPAEQERGIPLKYVNDDDASQRLEGPGFGARVMCSARSVIDCRQPPQIVLNNAGPARPETPVEALVDAINEQVGPDGGLLAEVVDVNPDTQMLVFTSDGDGFELTDVTPGTLAAIGLPQGEYSPQAIGFRSELGNPGTGFGTGDGSGLGYGNPFNRGGNGDSLIMYDTSVPPEFEGLSSSAFGTTYQYDLSKVDGSSILGTGLQSDVDVLYLESRRFKNLYSIAKTTGRNWVDSYNVSGWAYLDNGNVRYRQGELVDSGKLKNALIYQKDNGERVTDVTLHDPFKGHIVPEAERNLTYITDGDPVYYNNDGSNFSKHNVGELWWNTSTMRVRWYEQANVDYRADYWGSYITGSSFDVYEWIESKEIPAEYTGKGTPFNVDTYLVDQVFNRRSNTYDNTYYYWVRDIDKVPSNIKDRTVSARQVARLLRSPGTELIPTYSVIDDKTMLFNNVKEYLTDNNSVLQSNFSRKDSKYENKHETYTLLGENAELSRIPSDLINKLIDSIAGEDSQGNAVPDTNLNKYEMYGIKIRPRQTMFMKVKEARRELRSFVNREIGKLILTSDFYKGWNDYVTTSNLYEVTDWVEAGYISNNIKARLSVNSIKDMESLTDIENGVFVRIVDENNPDKIYEYDSAKDQYNLVKVIGGTIRIKKEFYSSAQTSLLATEIRQLLSGIINNVFKSSNITNKMYFAMLNYILTEQYQTEWFFKSSYFNIRQSADNLSQNITTKIDPFGDMSDYIKTVKPYTSKLRDFNDRKTHTEITKSFASDFDKPPYQPNLSIQARILDPAVSADANIISSNSEYSNWANTYVTAPTKIRTMTEKIFIDRNQSNIMALGNASISNTIANAYNQPTSLSAEDRMSQLLNDPANATPINHIERLFVYHPTIKDLNTKIANTTFSNDIITGLKATRNTTLRVLGYANFLGEELDANLFSKAYYDGIGNEILATQFGYDQTAFDSDGYDSDVVVNNYLSSTEFDSELVRDSITYAGFDSNTFFKGYAGPDRPPEHVMLHALEGLQFNVQSGSAGTNANVSFKMFLGLNGSVDYTRISTDFTTTLASAISKTDTDIVLTDATKVTSPFSGSKESVIFIGDERITFGAISGNTLKNVKRGTLGTSIENHDAGTKVIDASEQNRIEIGSQEFATVNNDPEIAYWNTANTALADSSTTIAQFLRDKPGSYFD